MISLSKNAEKTLLLCHAGSDVDAISSAAAVYFSIPNKNISIGCIDHLNLNAKAFSEKMKIPYAINPDLKKFEKIILIDFNSTEMAGSMKNQLALFKGKISAIDHHSIEQNSIALKENSVIDGKAISTTEIIYSMFKKEKIKISKKSFECIAAGIIADSANFTVAGKNSFQIMAECLEKSKSNFSEMVFLFAVEKDFSEKIASLKAAKRCKIYKIENFIISTSQVDSFEASAAMALVRIGADASFVAAFDEKTDSLNISARASNDFFKKAKINLSNVFFELSNHVEGKGGGHPCAAAFNGRGIPETALEECIKILFHLILEKNPKAQFKEYN